MRKSIYIKILATTLLMTLFFVIANNNYCLALGDVTSDRNWTMWRPSISGEVDLTNKIEPILGVIRTIGIIVSVATLAFIGIKFMYGSVEEKANYKQTLIPWIIGATMVFAITTIPSIIYDLTQNLRSNDVLVIGGYREYIEGYDVALNRAYTTSTNYTNREQDFKDYLRQANARYIQENDTFNNKYHEGVSTGFEAISNMVNVHGIIYFRNYASGYKQAINEISAGTVTQNNIGAKCEGANNLYINAGNERDKAYFFGKWKRLLSQKQIWEEE